MGGQGLHFLVQTTSRCNFIFQRLGIVTQEVVAHLVMKHLDPAAHLLESVEIQPCIAIPMEVSILVSLDKIDN